MMAEFTNGYFQMMDDIGRGYELEKGKRKAEKWKLLDSCDWEGIKEWNKREEMFPFPFTSGQMKAYRAYQNTRAYGSRVGANAMLEVRDMPWESEAHDFVTCLKEAGITEFAITDHSTALMNTLHELAEEGCELVGLCNVIRKDSWEDGEETSVNGILMRV